MLYTILLFFFLKLCDLKSIINQNLIIIHFKLATKIAKSQPFNLKTTFKIQKINGIEIMVGHHKELTRRSHDGVGKGWAIKIARCVGISGLRVL
jgi:hypothetical protein